MLMQMTTLGSGAGDCCRSCVTWGDQTNYKSQLTALRPVQQEPGQHGQREQGRDRPDALSKQLHALRQQTLQGLKMCGDVAPDSPQYLQACPPEPMEVACSCYGNLRLEQ